MNTQLPKHLAVIMDGNGRWGLARGRGRSYGHLHGLKAVRLLVDLTLENKIKHLTIFACGRDNRRRDSVEVGYIDALLEQVVKRPKWRQWLLSKQIKLQVIGDLTCLPATIQSGITDIVGITADFECLNLRVAYNYSGQWEIYHALQSCKYLCANSQDFVEFSGLLSQKVAFNVPAPDLLIRTGGRQRLSNFLLWDIGYTELFFTDKLWPDFGRDDFAEALLYYADIRRNYGLVDG